MRYACAPEERTALVAAMVTDACRQRVSDLMGYDRDVAFYNEQWKHYVSLRKRLPEFYGNTNSGDGKSMTANEAVGSMSEGGDGLPVAIRPLEEPTLPPPPPLRLTLSPVALQAAVLQHRLSQMQRLGVLLPVAGTDPAAAAASSRRPEAASATTVGAAAPAASGAAPRVASLLLPKPPPVSKVHRAKRRKVAAAKTVRVGGVAAPATSQSLDITITTDRGDVVELQGRSSPPVAVSPACSNGSATTRRTLAGVPKQPLRSDTDYAQLLVGEPSPDALHRYIQHRPGPPVASGAYRETQKQGRDAAALPKFKAAALQIREMLSSPPTRTTPRPPLHTRGSQQLTPAVTTPATARTVARRAPLGWSSHTTPSSAPPFGGGGGGGGGPNSGCIPLTQFDLFGHHAHGEGSASSLLRTAQLIGSSSATQRTLAPPPSPHRLAIRSLPTVTGPAISSLAPRAVMLRNALPRTPHAAVSHVAVTLDDSDRGGCQPLPIWHSAGGAPPRRF